MNRRKMILGLVLMMMLVLCFSSCSSGKEEANQGKVGMQLELPKAGEEIAVMSTSKGDIKIRFFPEQAPKAVENFKELSKSGYYNGVTFHRVIKDFMIQGGDPTATGAGGESIWGKAFEDEFSPSLLNITGSLSMANSGKNTNGSQFFINYSPKENFQGWDYYEEYWNKYKQYYDKYYNTQKQQFEASYGTAVDMTKVTDEVKALYEENGGNPSLDGYYSSINKGHTVFGQVFEGLEVVKEIDYTKTNSSDKPVEDIIINKIDIIAYEG
ncbi:MAG: peptidylprolyl isomerase [Clostridia bacterium]|nr:peptidylprolyl isomerase [Clostridia bacterium]